MGTGSGPVYERDNALTRALREIDQINLEHGTRAGGGGLPPDPTPPQRVVEGGSATVLPPPPRRILEPIEEAGDVGVTAEEQEELDRLWAEDVARRAGKAPEPTAPQRTAAPAGRMSAREFVGGVARPATFSDFSYIDMQNSVVIADNGEKFPIMPEELMQLRSFAFSVSARSMNMAMAALAKRLGLVTEQPAAKATEPPAADAGKKEEAPKEAPANGTSVDSGSGASEAVSPMPETPAGSGISEAPSA